jgi:hypothetical protein
MSEIQTPCPICGQHIEPDEPEAVPVEQREDHPGQGQIHDVIWSLRGFAHRRCVALRPDFRAAAERT